MSLLQMSISGALVILAVIVIRALTINRLPKKTFLALWGIALLRLLAPFSVPSPFSAYSVVNHYVAVPPKAAGIETPAVFPTQPAIFPATGGVLQEQAAAGISPYTIIWAIGMFACALFFAVAYFKCRREFRESLPIENNFLARWISAHKLTRVMEIRQSSRISAPLTYGIFKPIILMPKHTKWEDTKQIEYILAHEFVHVKRFDAAAKLLLTAALCVHWFNPLVWAMYILSNRDIELSCDESVVRLFGDSTKSAYALTLISMEETKNSLTPLCNNFSKNAIEERITAIMKMKRTSVIAAIVAIGLIVGVTTAFATSAAAPDQPLAAIPDTNFSQSDYDRLLALRFDGYEKMTVAEYQNKVWAMRDNAEYMALLERFSQDTQLYEMRDTNDTASFLFNTLTPLTAEMWQTRDFGGYAQAPAGDAQGDPAMLEYQLSLTILDAAHLTVGEYERARKGIMDGLQDYVQSRTNTELQNEDAMDTAISAEAARLSKKWGSAALKADIFYHYRSLRALDADTLKMISDEAEQSIAPYVPFGVTYELDEISGQTKYYWNKTQIRGIYDEERGVWITNSAGTGDSDGNAKEIIAVYTDKVLTGLREATLQEQAEWDRIRSDVPSHLQGEDEPRPYPPASAADYQSLLKLKTADYQNQSVSAFNAALLEWADEDFERNERVNIDREWNDFKVSLTDEERSFVTLTARASGEENAKLVQSNYTGRAKEDPILGNFNLTKESNDRNRMAWADLFYQLVYHISDETTLTVGERDRALAGVISEIQQYWDRTDIDTLVNMNEDSILKVVKAITERYSNDSIKISFRDDQVSFECMSEPRAQA